MSKNIKTKKFTKQRQMLERSRETLFVLIKYRSQTMKKIKKFPTIIVAVMEKDCEDENMKI